MDALYIWGRGEKKGWEGQVEWDAYISVQGPGTLN